MSVITQHERKGNHAPMHFRGLYVRSITIRQMPFERDQGCSNDRRSSVVLSPVDQLSELPGMNTCRGHGHEPVAKPSHATRAHSICFLARHRISLLDALQNLGNFLVDLTGLGDD